MTKMKPTGYSAIQISLHWLMAILVLFQLIFGESMTTVVDAAEEGTTVSAADQFLGAAHYWVGIAILCLVILRLAVRLRTGVPNAIGPATWMSTASTAAHWAFYGLLFAVPTSGLLALYVSDMFADIHAFGKPVFIVLIAVHAGAALLHHFVFKDGTLRRILLPVR